jgi:hypothetical protein
MTRIYRFSYIAKLSLCMLASSAWSQDLPDTTRVQWGVSGGVNRYQEKGLMQLQGPEIGVHAKLTQWSALPSVQWEADVLLGKQKYTSEGSGSMTGVTNLETRWRALTPVFSNEPTNQGFLTGLAVHTLWNDLRGTTTFNQKIYGGYERSAAQLWLPVRWSSGDMWDLDAGLLLYGRHTSKLSQVNTNYSDIVNTQHRGQYAQVSVNLALDNGDTLKPFVRYTHLGNSNIVVMNGDPWIEPESHRWQIGAIWEFNAR